VMPRTSLPGCAGAFLLLLAPPLHSREAPARRNALAACGVVKMDSPDYERKYWSFSLTERTVVREYDGPGYGAPRPWEALKGWE
jgi:hypothetical protein